MMPLSIQPSAIDDSFEYIPSSTRKKPSHEVVYQDWVEPGDTRSAIDAGCNTEHGFVPDHQDYAHHTVAKDAKELPHDTSVNVIPATTGRMNPHISGVKTMKAKTAASNVRKHHYTRVSIKGNDGQSEIKPNPWFIQDGVEAKSPPLVQTESSQVMEMAIPPVTSPSTSRNHNIRVRSKDGLEATHRLPLPFRFAKSLATTMTVAEEHQAPVPEPVSRHVNTDTIKFDSTSKPRVDLSKAHVQPTPKSPRKFPSKKVQEKTSSLPVPTRTRKIYIRVQDVPQSKLSKGEDVASTSKSQARSVKSELMPDDSISVRMGRVNSRTESEIGEVDTKFSRVASSAVLGSYRVAQDFVYPQEIMSTHDSGIMVNDMRSNNHSGSILEHDHDSQRVDTGCSQPACAPLPVSVAGAEHEAASLSREHAKTSSHDRSWLPSQVGRDDGFKTPQKAAALSDYDGIPAPTYGSHISNSMRSQQVVSGQHKSLGRDYRASYGPRNSPSTHATPHGVVREMYHVGQDEWNQPNRAMIYTDSSSTVHSQDPFIPDPSPEKDRDTLSAVPTHHSNMMPRSVRRLSRTTHQHYSDTEKVCETDFDRVSAIQEGPSPLSPEATYANTLEFMKLPLHPILESSTNISQHRTSVEHSRMGSGSSRSMHSRYTRQQDRYLQLEHFMHSKEAEGRMLENGHEKSLPSRINSTGRVGTSSLQSGSTLPLPRIPNLEIYMSGSATQFHREHEAHDENFSNRKVMSQQGASGDVRPTTDLTSDVHVQEQDGFGLVPFMLSNGSDHSASQMQSYEARGFADYGDITPHPLSQAPSRLSSTRAQNAEPSRHAEFVAPLWSSQTSRRIPTVSQEPPTTAQEPEWGDVVHMRNLSPGELTHELRGRGSGIYGGLYGTYMQPTVESVDSDTPAKSYEMSGYDLQLDGTALSNDFQASRLTSHLQEARYPHFLPQAGESSRPSPLIPHETVPGDSPARTELTMSESMPSCPSKNGYYIN